MRPISSAALAPLFILLTTPAQVIVIAQTCAPPPATLEDASTFNVRDFGATGDGISDDSASIQAALDTAAAVGGGTVCFPRGTYVVRPTTPGGKILTLSSTHMRLVGEGIRKTTIQVGASSLPYRGVLMGDRTNRDLTGLSVEHLTFDHNAANNAIASQAEIAANPQFTVAVFVGTDIAFHDLQILNASSINNVVVNGSACARVRIRRCRGSNLGDDPNHITHDASVFYVHAQDVVIADNVIESAGQDKGGARTAIETHGSRSVVRGNVLENWQTGMNITGIGGTETQDVVVSHNRLSGVCRGIRLWSAPYRSHTTGYGFNGVVVAHNTIRLSGVDKWPTQATASIEEGIAIAPTGTSLDVTKLTITGNVIVHPLEVSAVPNSVFSLGIGWYSVDSKTLSNARITNNTILNFPMAGIRLSCKLLNVVIAGNSCVNCGSTLWTGAAGTLAYRTPLFIAFSTATTVTIRDNTFIDSLSDVTWRPAYFIYLYAPRGGATVAGVALLNNTFTSTGSAMTGQIRIDDKGSFIQPYLESAINNFVTPSNKIARGSRIIDPATDTQSTIGDDQLTWSIGHHLATRL